MGKVFHSNWIFAIILTLVASWLMSPIFQTGMFTGHDIWHQVARFYHYAELFNAGIIPPGWVANLAQGYGYPLFFFSYHLPWLLGMPFVWSGVSVFSTIKLLFFLGFVLSGLSMYYSAYLVTKDRLAAFAAALIYLIAPHHFFSVFVSASIGTVYQFIFVPLIFALTTKIILAKANSKYTALLALSLAGSVLSHLMSFFFVAPLVTLYSLGLLLFRFKTLKKIYFSILTQLTTAVLAALVLTGFYLVPTITLLPQIQASKAGEAFSRIFEANFVNFGQLIYSKWGYGPIVSNAKDGEISFQVGIIQWLVVLVVGVYLVGWRLRSKSKHISRIYSFIFKPSTADQFWLVFGFVVLFWLAIYLMIDVSQPVWNLVTQFVALDYPFRYLLMTVVSASFLFGLIFSQIKSSLLRFTVLGCAVLIAGYTNRNHIQFNMFIDVPLDVYVRSEVTTNTFHEYLPKIADSSLLAESATVIQPGVTFDQIDLTAKGWSGLVSVKKEQEVLLHQFDFPGQIVIVDHVIAKHQTGDHGLISIQLPEGTHLVQTRYQASLLFVIVNALSVAALVYCLWLLIRKGEQR